MAFPRVGNLTIASVAWEKLKRQSQVSNDPFFFGRRTRSLRQPVRDMPFRDLFPCFDFRNSKLEILSLETQNFASEKFRVSKLKITSLQTRNFDFVNLKFQVSKLKINLAFRNSKF